MPRQIFSIIIPGLASLNLKGTGGSENHLKWLWQVLIGHPVILGQVWEIYPICMPAIDGKLSYPDFILSNPAIEKINKYNKGPNRIRPLWFQLYSVVSWLMSSHASFFASFCDAKAHYKTWQAIKYQFGKKQMTNENEPPSCTHSWACMNLLDECSFKRRSSQLVAHTGPKRSLKIPEKSRNII